MDAQFRCSFVCPATIVAATSAHCEIASAHQCRASVLRRTSARRIRSAQTCLHLRSQHTPAPQPGKWAVPLLRYEHDHRDPRCTRSSVAASPPGCYVSMVVRIQAIIAAARGSDLSQLSRGCTALPQQAVPWQVMGQCFLWR